MPGFARKVTALPCTTTARQACPAGALLASMFRHIQRQRGGVMSRIDTWTEATVDYVINLLVQAERAVKEVDGDLYEKIRRFLMEDA